MSKKLKKHITMFFCILTFMSAPVSASAIEVIVHSEQSIEDSVMSLHELRQIFTMRQRVWENGEKIVVFVLPSKSPVHQNFCKHKLKIFPYQLDRIWRKLTYSGLGQMPSVVHSVKEMKEAVRSTPGSIAYIDEYYQGDNVHVIKISQ